MRSHRTSTCPYFGAILLANEGVVMNSTTPNLDDLSPLHTDGKHLLISLEWQTWDIKQLLTRPTNPT